MSFLNPTVDILECVMFILRVLGVIPPHYLYSHGNLDVQCPLIGAVNKYICSLFLTHILRHSEGHLFVP
jgi:hypothetical protein